MLGIIWGLAWVRGTHDTDFDISEIGSLVVWGTLEGQAKEAAKVAGKFGLLGLQQPASSQCTHGHCFQTRANEVLGAPTEGVERKIKPLTEALAQKRLKLLGHVLRRERQHRLHQSAFKTQSAVPRETEHRRIGRPRKFWTTTNMEKAWIITKTLDTSIRDIPFNKHDREIRENIIDHAKRYQPPFS